MRKRTSNTLIAVGIWLAIVLLLFAGYVAFLEIAGSPGHHQQQRDTQARRSGDVGGSTSQPKSPGTGNDQTANSTDSDSGATLTGWIQAASAALIAFLTLAILAAYRHQTQIMLFALAETQKAGNSTSRTVRLMESVAQHQLRAYIGIEKIGFTSKNSQKPRLISSGITIEDLIIITIKNYGSTSAYDVRTSVNLVAMTAGDKLPDDFLYKDIKSSIPDQDSYTEPLIIEPDRSHIVRCPYNSEFRKKIDEANMKKIGLFVYGHIDYSDVFNRRWERTFCFRYTPHAGRKDKFTCYERHNNEKCIYNPSVAVTT